MECAPETEDTKEPKVTQSGKKVKKKKVKGEKKIAESKNASVYKAGDFL